jgi:dUTP pyrophosphatase
LKPFRKHDDDAGYDLRAKHQVVIKPHSQASVETGVSLEMPVGVVGIVKTRSSFGKEGYDVTAGVIDAGYRGKISVILQNHTNYDKVISKGERIAQLLFLPHLKAKEMVEGEAPLNTKRGAKGFGSTGRN